MNIELTVDEILERLSEDEIRELKERLNDIEIEPVEKEAEPYYAPGTIFEYNGVKLMSVESEHHECRGCYFRELGNCLDAFEVHGCCAASDIGRAKSIKFIKVENE